MSDQIVCDSNSYSRNMIAIMFLQAHLTSFVLYKILKGSRSSFRASIADARKAKQLPVGNKRLPAPTLVGDWQVTSDL